MIATNLLLNPLVWSLGALLLYALATNLDWLLRNDPSALGSWSERLGLWSSDAARRELLRLSFLLGLPLLALLLRVPSAAQFGLPSPPLAAQGLIDPRSWQPAGKLPWLQDFGIVLAVAAISIALLVLGRAWRAAAEGHASRPGWSKPGRKQVGNDAMEVLAREAHWALMRAGILSIGLANQGLAVFLSLALIGLEALTNPEIRNASDDADRLSRGGQLAVMAIASGLIFIYTGSSLWAAAGHLLITLVLAGLLDPSQIAGPRQALPVRRPRGRRPRRAPQPDPSESIEPTIV
jgi:heme A synthase